MSENTQFFIALGSNIEPREGFLRAAREALRSVPHEQWAESPIYQSTPVGGPTGQSHYLNQVVSFHSAISAEDMLCLCKRIESRLGRIPRARWSQREIDLDILYRGTTLLNNEHIPLIIPHERIAERLFVLLPLHDLAPDWIDPRTGLSVRAMLNRLTQTFTPEAIDLWKGFA